WTELRLEGGAEIDRQSVPRHLDRDRESQDFDRAQADMGGNLDLEGRRAAEVEAARIAEADAEIELELGVEPRQDLRDEAVALRGVEDEGQPFGLGFGEHLDVAAADEQEAGGAACRDDLEPRALALAQDRERRLVLAGEFQLDARRALGVHRCAGL